MLRRPRRSQTTRAYRRDLASRIGERRERLFDDRAPTAALAEFLAHCDDR